MLAPLVNVMGDAMNSGYASIPRSVLHDETIPTGAKVVLLVLSSYVGVNDTAWPSHATIGKLAGMSDRSVRRHLMVLRDHKLITWDQRRSATGDLTSNIYRLLDPSGMRLMGTDNLAVSDSGGTDKLAVPTDNLSKGTDTMSGGTDTMSEERTSMNVEENIDVREDVERICCHLSERIKENGCKKYTVTDAWRVQARLLLDKDGWPEDKIHTLIDWCQDNSFWRSNILSMPKFRNKYDQLRLAAIDEWKRKREASEREEKRQQQQSQRLQPVPAYVETPAPAPETLPWRAATA